MKNRAFGLFVAGIGIAILGWGAYGMLFEQKSIEDKVTQAYVLASIILLYLGLEGWRSGSESKAQRSASVGASHL